MSFPRPQAPAQRSHRRHKSGDLHLMRSSRLAPVTVTDTPLTIIAPNPSSTTSRRRRSPTTSTTNNSTNNNTNSTSVRRSSQQRRPSLSGISPTSASSSASPSSSSMLVAAALQKHQEQWRKSTVDGMAGRRRPMAPPAYSGRVENKPLNRPPSPSSPIPLAEPQPQQQTPPRQRRPSPPTTTSSSPRLTRARLQRSHSFNASSTKGRNWQDFVSFTPLSQTTSQPQTQTQQDRGADRKLVSVYSDSDLAAASSAAAAAATTTGAAATGSGSTPQSHTSRTTGVSSSNASNSSAGSTHSNSQPAVTHAASAPLPPSLPNLTMDAASSLEEPARRPRSATGGALAAPRPRSRSRTHTPKRGVMGLGSSSRSQTPNPSASRSRNHHSLEDKTLSSVPRSSTTPSRTRTLQASSSSSAVPRSSTPPPPSPSQNPTTAQDEQQEEQQEDAYYNHTETVCVDMDSAVEVQPRAFQEPLLSTTTTGPSLSSPSPPWMTWSQQTQQSPTTPSPSGPVPFLQALVSVEIPPYLLTDTGVHVVLVSANGKTQLLQLSISKDKFTIKLKSPVAATVTTAASPGATSSKLSSAASAATNPSTVPTTTSLSSAVLVRSIDVGEMDRIQRGQSTQQFETAKKKRNMLESSRSESQRRINVLSNESNNTFETIFSSPNPTVVNSNNTNTGGGGASSVSSVSSGTLTSSLPSASASSLMSASAAESNASNLLYSLDPDRSFSIIFRGAQTLDLMAMHRRARDDICNALDCILTAYTQAKGRVAADVRLLRFVWLHIVDRDQQTQQSNALMSRWTLGGSSNHNNNNHASQNNNNRDTETGEGHVNAQQIAREVFTQMNFFMKPKDVIANYEKFGKVIGLDRRQRRQGLTFDQLAEFFHYIRRNSWVVKPVTALWNELFGEVMNNGKRRETVSAQTFLEKFLHQKQGQLDANLSQVYDLFAVLHTMEIAHNTSAAATTTTTTMASSGTSNSHSDRPNSRSGKQVVYNRITKDQFEAYLLATENDAFAPEKERVDLATMNKPLSEYFINSSHNTYLIGDQYTSHSRVEMYSNALYRGCRCLELDIWDGGKSPGDNTPIPVVWHGHTMTTKIFFVDIIRTIKVFLNFHPDTFPIILSFENHCSLPYQQVMAKQLERILGSALYIPTEASLNGPLPSPAKLRGMVVIKGRRPANWDTGRDTETDYGDSDDDSDDEGTGTGTGGGPGSTTAPSVSESTTTNTTTTTTTTTFSRREKKAQQRHGIAPELARLTLFHGTKFKKSWPDSIRSPNHHMHSFSENKVRSAARRQGASSNPNNAANSNNPYGGGPSLTATSQRDEWVVYNQTHMSRTYPGGSRVDSSNYNPISAWALGCQMVALNFQTEDAFLRLNDGRFRENGNCGYVLKPSSLMVPKHELKLGVPVRLNIQVLSGSCLPKPKGRRTGDCIDPYVRLAVYDVNADGREAVSDYATSVVRCNGFFPVFARHMSHSSMDSSSAFEFVVETWAAAILQMTVYDKSGKKKTGGEGGEFVASCSIPISCLRQGIRSVKLYDATNTRSGAFDFASLLLDINMTQVIAEI